MTSTVRLRYENGLWESSHTRGMTWRKIDSDEAIGLNEDAFIDIVAESEQLDELSRKTLASYVSKTSRDISKLGRAGQKASDHGKSAWDPHFKKQSKRFHGLDTAVSKLAKEEFNVDLTEEQIDEISKEVLGRYVDSAHRQIDGHIWDRNKTKARIKNGALPADPFQKEVDWNNSEIAKRKAGIKKATKKLRKEDIDQIEFDQEIVMEISKELMGRYLRHAGPEIHMSAHASGMEQGKLQATGKATADNPNDSPENPLSKTHKLDSMATKRRREGISRIGRKLSGDKSQVGAHQRDMANRPQWQTHAKDAAERVARSMKTEETLDEFDPRQDHRGKFVNKHSAEKRLEIRRKHIRLHDRGVVREDTIIEADPMIDHLRAVASGKHQEPLRFADGHASTIPHTIAQKAVSQYEGLAPAAKAQFTQSAGASLSAFKKSVGLKEELIVEMDLETAKKKAHAESKKGYAQHVNHLGGERYEVSDWHGGDNHVVGYENGNELPGGNLHQHEEEMTTEPTFEELMDRVNAGVQLDELSKGLLRRYIDNAGSDYHRSHDIADASKKGSTKREFYRDRAGKRDAGLNRALGKENETGYGSKVKRYATEDLELTEDQLGLFEDFFVENEINELSNETMKSYSRKAAAQLVALGSKRGRKSAKDIRTKNNREAGYTKATNKVYDRYAKAREELKKQSRDNYNKAVPNVMKEHGYSLAHSGKRSDIYTKHEEHDDVHNLHVVKHHRGGTDHHEEPQLQMHSTNGTRSDHRHSYYGFSQVNDNKAHTQDSHHKSISAEVKRHHDWRGLGSMDEETKHQVNEKTKFDDEADDRKEYLSRNKVAKAYDRMKKQRRAEKYRYEATTSNAGELTDGVSQSFIDAYQKILGIKKDDDPSQKVQTESLSESEYSRDDIHFKKQKNKLHGDDHYHVYHKDEHVGHATARAEWKTDPHRKFYVYHHGTDTPKRGDHDKNDQTKHHQAGSSLNAVKGAAKNRLNRGNFYSEKWLKTTTHNLPKES